MLTNEQLEDEVKRIAELDQKRTQGDWKPLQSQSYCEPSPAEFCYGILAYTGDVYKCGIVDSEGTDLTNYPNAPHDFAFIAHAPQMAQNHPPAMGGTSEQHTHSKAGWDGGSCCKRLLGARG